jgi:hypothetical protein
LTNLTHKSGATNTAAIPVGGIVAGNSNSANNQLLPITARKTLKFKCDGEEKLNDGVYKFRGLVISECYDIVDYKAIYDAAAANIGTQFQTLLSALGGMVCVSNSFNFCSKGRVRVETSYYELLPTTLSICGAVQSFPQFFPGYSGTRYVHGMGVVGGLNWSNGVDLTSYSTTNDLPASAQLQAGKVSAFHLDVFSKSGEPLLGFAVGYFPFGARHDDAGAALSRASKAPTALWNMRDFKKVYPAFTQGEVAGWGRITVSAYRVYVDEAGVSEILAKKTSAHGAWASLNSIIEPI